MVRKARNERGKLLVEWSLTLAVRVLLSVFLLDIGLYYIKSLFVATAATSAADYLRIAGPNRSGNSVDTMALNAGLKVSVVQASGGLVKNTDICAYQDTNLSSSDCLKNSEKTVDAGRPTPSSTPNPSPGTNPIYGNSEPYWVNIAVGAPFKALSGFLPTTADAPLTIKTSVGVRVPKEPPLLNIGNCLDGQQLVYDEASHTLSCQYTFGGFFTKHVCAQDFSTGDMNVGIGCRNGNSRLSTLAPKPADPCSCPPNFSPVAIARWSNYSGSGPCKDIHYENRGAIFFLCVIGKS